MARKRLSIFLVGFLILIIFLIFLSFLKGFGNIPTDISNITDSNIPNTSNVTIENDYTPKFIPLKVEEYPIWESSPIFYSFNGECTPDMKMNVQTAFNTLQKRISNLSFEEGYNEKSIVIYCHSDESKKEGESVIGGEASAVINPETNEITSGEINLYKIDCAEYYCSPGYNLELHEILHVLGLSHIENRLSIMNIADDGQYRDLDQEIIDCLKKIYNKEQSYFCDKVNFVKTDQIERAVSIHNL